MKTTAAIEDSQACSNAAHRWIGNSQRCSCRRPHSAPSIAPSSSPNNRNRLANLALPYLPVLLSVLIGSGARQIVLMTIDREVLSHEMNSSVFVADARGNTSGPTGQREDGRHSREGQTGRTRRRSAETHRSILA